MDCQRVREVTAKPGAHRELSRYEFNQYLKHLRTCPECREQISHQDRAKAIHAMVLALE